MPRDSTTGPFADDWKRAYASLADSVEEVDITNALSSAAFSVKDPAELVSCKQVLYCFVVVRS